MTKRRIKTIEQLRNLPQYRNKSVTELEVILEGIMEGKTEEKVQEVLASFEENYDLSDMSANDMLGLRNLAHYYVYLENINGKTDEALREGNINMVERLIRTAERVQKSITDIQTNLAITRKQRKSDKEQDVVSLIDDLKARAKKFLESRLSYVYCPECKMLLANVWFLYPDEERNVLRLRCNRLIDADSGKMCNHEFTVTAQFLAENENRNIEGVLKT